MKSTVFQQLPNELLSWLAEQISKLEGAQLAYFWHVNPAISQQKQYITYFYCTLETYVYIAHQTEMI